MQKREIMMTEIIINFSLKKELFLCPLPLIIFINCITVKVFHTKFFFRETARIALRSEGD